MVNILHVSSLWSQLFLDFPSVAVFPKLRIQQLEIPKEVKKAKSNKSKKKYIYIRSDGLKPDI